MVSCRHTLQRYCWLHSVWVHAARGLPLTHSKWLTPPPPLMCVTEDVQWKINKCTHSNVYQPHPSPLILGCLENLPESISDGRSPLNPRGLSDSPLRQPRGGSSCLCSDPTANREPPACWAGSHPWILSLLLCPPTDPLSVNHASYLQSCPLGFQMAVYFRSFFFF